MIKLWYYGYGTPMQYTITDYCELYDIHCSVVGVHLEERVHDNDDELMTYDIS